MLQVIPSDPSTDRRVRDVATLPPRLLPGLDGYEGVGMKRLLEKLRSKSKAQPVTQPAAREAVLDMRLRAVQDELQSLRADLNERIDNAAKVIDEVRESV